MGKMKIGIIGLGCRGSSMMEMILEMEDIEITAVCDLYSDRVDAAAEKVSAKLGKAPFKTGEYMEVIKHPDTEAIMVFTAWETHIEITVEAMRNGKPVACDVGGAYSIDDCWKLVRTYEQTQVPCMLLENCCYGRNEMMLLNMLKLGVFGELVHCQGGYRHDLRYEISHGKENRHYRLRNYLNRNCENYPTHELGPIAQLLDINRGNRMVSLVSMASKSSGLHEYILKEKGKDDFLANACFAQGDVITTIIKCARGETIVLFLDTTLPRAYSRALQIQGTKAAYTEDNQSFYIDGVHDEFHGAWKDQWGNINELREKYDHPMWKEFNPGGNREKMHGGMDYLVVREFVGNVRAKKPLPIDVYDMAAWMSVSALSEISIATGKVVDVPDFTNGRWLLGEF